MGLIRMCVVVFVCFISSFANAECAKPPVSPCSESALGNCGFKCTSCANAGDYHLGVDLKANAYDTIYATVSGKVVHAAWHEGYGGTILIQDDTKTNGENIVEIHGHLLCGDNPENQVHYKADTKGKSGWCYSGGYCPLLSGLVGTHFNAGDVIGKAAPKTANACGTGTSSTNPHHHWGRRKATYSSSVWLYYGYTDDLTFANGYLNPADGLENGTCGTMSGCVSYTPCVSNVVPTGPICACTTGPCCDGCNFRPSSWQCGEVPVKTDYQCTGEKCGDDVQVRTSTQFCDGSHSDCGMWNLQASTWKTLSNCNDTQKCNSWGNGGQCQQDSSCSTSPPAQPPPSGNDEKGCVAKDTKTCDGCACGPCVCEMDPYCCYGTWDELCVDECKNKCGGCGGVAQTPIPTPPPTCVCTTGACCDGCNFRPVSYLCGNESLWWCASNECNAEAVHQINKYYCTGFSSDCTNENAVQDISYITPACVPGYKCASSGGLYSCNYDSACTQKKPASPQELVKNGSFEMQFESWFSDVSECGTAIITSDCTTSQNGPCSMKFINAKVQPDYQVRVVQDNIPLELGATYALKFAARSDTLRSIRAWVGNDTPPSASLGCDKSQMIGTSWQTYTITFTATGMNQNATLAFETGNDLPTVWIDSVSLLKQ